MPHDANGLAKINGHSIVFDVSLNTI